MPRGYFRSTFEALAFLRAKRGAEAAAEFQKIVDHRGIAPTTPEHSLAKLGLGRAYAMTGDTAKARAAYQDFFALWKDADPDAHDPERSQGGIRDPEVAISILRQSPPPRNSRPQAGLIQGSGCDVSSTDNRNIAGHSQPSLSNGINGNQEVLSALKHKRAGATGESVRAA